MHSYQNSTCIIKNQLFNYRTILFTFVLTLNYTCPVKAQDIACNGQDCDTKESVAVLAQYEQSVDKWRQNLPLQQFLAPHWGPLQLTERDQRRADDYVSVLEFLVADEAEVQSLHPNEDIDDLAAYPSYASVLYHATARLYGRLFPNSENISKYLEPAQQLWTDDDTQALLNKNGIDDKRIMAFLSSIKYGDFGLKLFCAKNFHLTNKPNTEGVEKQIILDYTFDLLTDEYFARSIATEDFETGKRLESLLKSELRTSRAYTGFYDGLLAEINEAVLLHDLIAFSNIDLSSEELHLAGTVNTRSNVMFSNKVSVDTGEFQSYADRLYSQFLQDGSNFAVLGAGSQLYTPWTQNDTDVLASLITKRYPETAIPYKIYSDGKALLMLIVVKNDPNPQLSDQFREDVEAAIIIEYAIKNGIKAGYKSFEIRPMGKYSPTSGAQGIVRGKILALTPEEEAYKKNLQMSLSVSNIVTGVIPPAK